ncbi:hypothetical protein AYL99_08431 [Fonsecaea erecta]|uniref:Mid2 domain-containing protein n=1 Tax=Fonsecaea erecta TaxID=1367422 RepID=A0A178ZET4_9EURO|nr:hypothetical protein AYL99_08431 [Fonsecaea erecta]OAP57693.1 hypothetical protein AYL99_08431 [Fonsecaea erecta]
MLLLSFLAFAVSSANAQSQDNIFLNPPTNGINNDFTQNPTYVQGSTITLQWETTYPSTDLVIWQNGNPNSQVLEGGITATTLSWTVGTGESPPFDLSKGNVFFFQMYNSSTSTFFSSHYFNVSDPSLASATSSTASSSTTSPPATSPTHEPTSSSQSDSSKATPATTSIATTMPAAAADSSSSHSSNKLGEGLGIGIGLCVFLVLVAGLAWYLFRRRVARSRDLLKPETMSTYPDGGMADESYPAQYRRYELGSTAPATQAELDGGNMKFV